MPCPRDLLQLLLALVLLSLLMALVYKRFIAKPQLPPEAPYILPKTPETKRLFEPTEGPLTVTALQEKGDPLPPVMNALVENIDPIAAKQLYDAFLVVDVEATCMPGTDFNYANEIIASLFYHTSSPLSHTFPLAVNRNGR